MKPEEWDKREEARERIRWVFEEGAILLKNYVPLVEEYAKLNDFEIPPEDDNDHLNVIYGIVYDAEFIDYAYDKSGIIFNKNMFEFDDEASEELDRLWKLDDPQGYEDFFDSFKKFHIYSDLVERYVNLNDIAMPSLDDENREHMIKLYGFIRDNKFIDFARKESGITFTKQMFEPTIDEFLKPD